MVMKHNNEQIHSDCKVRIFNFLNKSQHESLYLEPVIILITFLQTKNVDVVMRITPQNNDKIHN